MAIQCPECRESFDMPVVRCPHCATPAPYPNVWAAQRQDNVAELDRRFQDALADASIRGCAPIVLAFMAKVAASKAVIARRLHDVERLSYSDREGYATYYQQLNAEIRLPDADEWDQFRRSADEALFPGYKDDVRFAALTIDDRGVLNYGEWSIVLRSAMIQHRTSTFEENSLVFVKAHRIPIAEAEQALRGHRAAWDDRAKLGVAKLAAAITPATKEEDFAGLLIYQGPPGKTADDRFVEAHLFGPLTIRTAEKIVLTKSRDSRRLASKTRLRAIAKNLKAFGVELEVRP
jgi:hypothetical protein